MRRYYKKGGAVKKARGGVVKKANGGTTRDRAFAEATETARPKRRPTTSKGPFKMSPMRDADERFAYSQEKVLGPNAWGFLSRLTPRVLSDKEKRERRKAATRLRRARDAAKRRAGRE